MVEQMLGGVELERGQWHEVELPRWVTRDVPLFQTTERAFIHTLPITARTMAYAARRRGSGPQRSINLGWPGSDGDCWMRWFKQRARLLVITDEVERNRRWGSGFPSSAIECYLSLDEWRNEGWLVGCRASQAEVDCASAGKNKVGTVFAKPESWKEYRRD